VREHLEYEQNEVARQMQWLRDRGPYKDNS